MLYTENLEELIFRRHEIYDTDELVILSGYLGPRPVARLKKLPFRTTVIYGMYGSEGIRSRLHNSLIAIQGGASKKSNIFYSKLPVHSKCYIWKKKNKIVYALIGSANFSINGLTTPFREVLAETTLDTFESLDNYINHVLSNSVSCLEIDAQRLKEEVVHTGDCLLTLLDGRTGEVHNVGGLNWGQGIVSHTRPNDAYIPIRIQDIRNFPDLFPPKQTNPMDSRGGRRQRHNDFIEIIWDDGVVMRGLLEGTQTINGIVYPKQIGSSPVKDELGKYMRNRLGVPLGQPVRKHHLEAYGRTNIEVSLLSDGVYSFNFSKTKSK